MSKTTKSRMLAVALTLAAAGPLTFASSIAAPATAEAGVLSTIKSGAKKVGGAVKAGAKGVANAGKTAGVGIGSGVKRGAVAAGKAIAKNPAIKPLKDGVVTVVKRVRRAI